MSSTHSSSNDPAQYRDSSQEYVPHGGTPGQNPTVPANQVLGVLWLIAFFAFFGLMMNELDTMTRSTV